MDLRKVSILLGHCHHRLQVTRSLTVAAERADAFEPAGGDKSQCDPAGELVGRPGSLGISPISVTNSSISSMIGFCIYN